LGYAGLSRKLEFLLELCWNDSRCTVGLNAGVLDTADPTTAVVESLGRLNLGLGEIEVSENILALWFVLLSYGSN